MSLVRSLAHNTAVQIVGKIVSTVLGLLAIAMMTRALSLEQFGWYATATGFLQFVGIFSDFGFTVTISNMLSEPRFAKRAILDTVTSWRLITAVGLQVLAIIVAWFFPYPFPIKIALIIMSLAFIATAINNTLVGWYRAELKLIATTWAELLGRGALIAGIALVTFSQAGFYAMMTAVTLGSVVSVIFLSFKTGKINFSLDKAISRDMFVKMWPTALAVIFNSFYLQGDRVILPFFVAQTEVALYAVAYRVLDIILQISAMLMGMVMPLITFAWSRGMLKEFKQRYQLGFDLMALLLLPMSVGAIVLATPLMRFVGGVKYAPAGFILGWLAISIFGTCFGMVFGHIALAINRQKQTLWVYVSDAILSVIGYFIFIPRFGLGGAIGVTIFSEFYAGILLATITIYYARILPNLNNFIKIVLASLLMGLMIYALQPMEVIWSIAAGAVIYALWIVVLRIISVKTITEILSLKTSAESVEVVEIL